MPGSIMALIPKSCGVNTVADGRAKLWVGGGDGEIVITGLPLLSC